MVNDITEKQHRSGGQRMSKPTCVGCEHIADFAGNYTECVLLHRFVDWYYWQSLAPDDCPKRKEMEQEGEE